MSIKRKIRRIRKNWRFYVFYSFLIIILLTIILLLKINIAGLLIAIMLMVIASFSKIYKRFTSASLGFELITPVVVLFAYKYGIVFAMLCAFIMLIVSSFIAGKLDALSTACEMIDYLILSVLTVIFSIAPFVPLAIVMIFLRNIIMVPLAFYLMGRNPVHLVIIIGSDIALNLWVVLRYGDLIAGMM